MRRGREMIKQEKESLEIQDLFNNIQDLPINLQDRINLFLSGLDERRKLLER